MKRVYGVSFGIKPMAIEQYDKDENGGLTFNRVLFKVIDATEHECKMITDMLNRLEKMNEA